MAAAPARPGVRNPRATLLVVGVAGVAVAYFIYSRRKAATAAAAAAASPASTDTTAALTPTPAGTYDPNADTSALLGYLTGLSGAGSTPAAPAAASGTTSPAPTYQQVPGNGDAANQTLDILGSIIGPSTYSGYNVVGGEPVYALVGGQWKLGIPASKLPVGTPLATPTSAEPFITPTKVGSEHLG